MMPSDVNQLVLLVAFLFCFSSNGEAFNSKHSPFDVDAWKDRVLQAAPINKPCESGKFQDGNLTIEWMAEDLESGKIEVRYGNRLVKIVESGDHSVLLSKVYYADIDRNGYPDVLIAVPSLGNGLEAHKSSVVAMFQTEPGHFRTLDFETLFFDPKDFADIDDDGMFELLLLDLAQIECADGRVHSFWAYLSHRINNYNLIRIEEGMKFIWFSGAPNSVPTDKLTDRQKNEYLATLPQAINSEAIN